MPAINGLRNGTSTARTRNAFKTAELLDMERLRFGSRQKFVLGGVRRAVEALLQADDRNRDVGVRGPKLHSVECTKLKQRRSHHESQRFDAQGGKVGC
jgi:hypothetical protein